MTGNLLVLAVDSGATTIRARLAQVGLGHTWTTLAEGSSSSGSVDELKRYIANFAHHHLPPDSRIDAAVIGVPGRVSDDRLSASLTYIDPNLPSGFSDLFEALGVRIGALFNDVECGARGVRMLAPSQVVDLCGYRPAGPLSTERFVLGMPGTGFGVGISVAKDIVIPSEGGHMPAGRALHDELESRVFDLAASAWGGEGESPLDTYEDLVSGPSLARIFQAVLESSVKSSLSLEEFRAVEPRLRSISVTAAARDPRSLAQEAAMTAFRCYGAFLGRSMRSLAMVTLPQAVFLGGSIVMGTHDLFREAFTRSFQADATHSEFLARLPVLVCLNVDLNLDGATDAAIAALVS